MSSSFSQQYDVVIVGGGINGAVSAARLSASGIKVLLVDKGDFASTTSQESSNLVWGGIKYLQSYEFGLVYKLCQSRNELLRSYPNRIRQIGFLASLGPTAPFGKVLGWLGTNLYWGIGAFATKAPKVFSATSAQQIEPSLKPGRAALEYFDAYLPDNDSRFVYEFIKTAQQLGAECRNYQEVTETNYVGMWQVKLRDSLTGEETTVHSKALINATGPYAGDVAKLMGTKNKSQLVLSKGIHLVVPKIHTTNHVLAFWDEQGRMFYVIPMHDRSVIGTTDTRVPFATKEVTDDDRDFVLRQINKEMNLVKPLTVDDIISERCGVRPLVTNGNGSAEPDWHKLSRKHAVEADENKRAVTIFGGKLTDCLNVGEEVYAELKKFGIAGTNARPQKWFGEATQVAQQQFELAAATVLGNDEIAKQKIAAIWRRQSVAGQEIIKAIKSDASLADAVFDGLDITYAEIDYVLRNEQIRTPEDLLRRRLPIAMTRSKSDIENNERLMGMISQVSH